VQAPIYCLAIVSDTGDKIKMQKCQNDYVMVWCVSDFRFTHGEWWRLKLRVRGVTQEVRPRGLNRRTRDRNRIRPTNEHTEALHSSTTRVRHHAAQQSTALDNHHLLFRHSVHVYIHYSNCSLNKTDYRCKPYILRKRRPTCPKLTLSLLQLLLHSILLLSFASSLTYQARVAIHSLDAWLLILL